MNWHQACELPYYHGSDLGANPTAEETTFKLWAPTACGVVVCLYATGTDAEPGAKELGVHEMRRGDGGVEHRPQQLFGVHGVRPMHSGA